MTDYRRAREWIDTSEDRVHRELAQYSGTHGETVESDGFAREYIHKWIF